MRSRLLLLGLALSTASCGSSAATSTPSRPLVVATTTQLGDVVREIAGDRAVVHQILQPNSDPHEYEPRPADIRSTAGAKIVFESGNGLDAWMGDVVKSAGGDPAIVTIAPAHLADK